LQSAIDIYNAAAIVNRCTVKTHSWNTGKWCNWTITA